MPKSCRFHPIPGSISEIAVLHDEPTWMVRLECSVAAETQRIFQALTLPEHMESWLSLPCCGSNNRNRAFAAQDGFSVAHACSDGHPFTTIAGEYATCRTRKLRFSWTVAGDVVLDRTVVDIRLSGDFGRSVLRLQHSGFRSEPDCRWHQALWSASLERLCKFFDPSLVHGRAALLRVH